MSCKNNRSLLQAGNLMNTKAWCDALRPQYFYCEIICDDQVVGSRSLEGHMSHMRRCLLGGSASFVAKYKLVGLPRNWVSCRGRE